MSRQSTLGTRRSSRVPAQGEARLEWNDRVRGRQTVSARILNISRSGISLAVLNEIAPGTYVQIKCKQYALAGMASVKHCSRHGMGYQAGLEFSGFEWRAPQEHATEP